MFYDLREKIVSSVHKICVTSRTNYMFLPICASGLRWQDNFNIASCLDNKLKIP